MKKFVTMLAALALLIPSFALAESTELEGSVQAARTVALLAPYSGVIAGVDAQAGDVLEAGHALMSIGTTKVYADFDGTVTAVFAEAGDSAASVQERYGALLYMERDALYMATCTISGAGSDNENKIVHAGEHVYFRSSENDDRHGEAIVTEVEGKNYTLLVTEWVDVRYTEKIKVYRDDRFRSENCIGTGSISRIDPVKVTGDGYVLAVHVQEGQTVSRGDLLFEMVPDQLDDMQGGSGEVVMPENGVVVSVAVADGAQTAKDGVLMTYCPQDALKIVCAADEDDLAKFSLGDEMTVTLDAYPGKELRGTVAAIAGLSGGDGGRVTFDVTIALEDNDLARIGMSATVKKK